MIRKIFVMCSLALLGPIILKATEPQPAPAALMDCANHYFSQWKQGATEDPDAYRVGGMESSLATAKLQEPYHYYRLYPDDLDRYLKSTEESPLPFSSDTKYLFPVVSAEGVYLGALKLVLNKRDDGTAILEGACEFIMTGGRYPNGDVVTREILQCRKAPLFTGRTIGFVQFGRTELPGCLVISREASPKSIRLLPFQASRRAKEFFAQEGVPSTESEELGKSARTVKAFLLYTHENP